MQIKIYLTQDVEYGNISLMCSPPGNFKNFNLLVDQTILSHIYERSGRPGNKLVPNLSQRLECGGLPSFVLTRWWTQKTEREHGKQVFKTRLYFNYFVASILKVVRSLFNLFTQNI